MQETTFLVSEEKEYQDCQLERVSASGLTLSESWFRRIILDHCWFDGTNFQDGSFIQTTFRFCDCSEADFRGSHFRECRFEGCKLLGAHFSDAVLEQCVFTGSNLSYTDWHQATWKRGMSFSDCDLQEGALTSLTFTTPPALIRCDLTGASLTDTKLQGIDLSGTVLDGIIVSPDFRELKGAKISLAQTTALANLLGVTVEG
ncbi:MAG: pentapeptide repeat-containing protein [Sphaerochaeta sp.]|jgi:uncharacterized protein YjbI with pentapeptide repeats|nr:pentapeptide repeat-containing protein [Sphaerochaeta sp.]MCH3919537.1 pentapeptide repeat-containing protein [Sphaerochaeta sp.]MCI2076842.1 pentapeptide repeat-containing protein [Sphaerochaeta sp.]MCI2096342.1 pentapeptide repeat-containing protein [Sphaerochaeta sp.]MCI2104278.1 pentapeptide repeat-containing protein [Sphaerochaeta sp.]